MKIKNTEVKVPCGYEQNDKDLMFCLLTTLKNMEKNYAVSLTEASNDNLYNVYKKQFDEISKLQRDTFTHIFRNGWYELETVDNTKIDEKYNMLNKCIKDLSK